MAIDFKKLVKGLFIKDSSDPSKGLKLEIDPTAATNTTTTILAEQQANVLLSLPGENSELVGDIANQTLENKTIDAANNTIVGITDAEISATAGIDATKIGDGSVDNTEFQYLDGVSSNIQTQLTINANDINGHITNPSGAHAASAISNTPSGNLSATDLQAAVNELQSDIDTRALASNLTAHITDTTDAHLASAIGYSGNANSTVEGALDNLYTYKLTVGSSQQLVSDLNANNNKITALATPVSGTDAANKNYVDGIAAGLDPKESVRVATTASVGGSYATTPSNGRFTGAATTIDGVALSTNDRVLIKDQADAKQNGIYVYDGAGQFTRSADMDGSPSSEVSGGNFVFVAQGSTNGASGFVLVASGIVTLNTDNLNFTQFSGGANSANKTLSNLDAPTSINQDLLPSANNSKSLGSSSLNYQNAYITTLKDNAGVDSHAVSSRILKDSAGSNSIDYSNTSEVSLNSKKLNSVGSAAGLAYATNKQDVQDLLKNFIANGDAEGAQIFSVYNDSSTTRPVDGTGGTQANLAVSISSTSPLDKTNSFLLTKSGSASTQGSGFSVPFTIGSAYKAKVLQIEFDYIVNSGTFSAGSSSTESDVIAYIYDVTNSQLIEPSSIKLLSNSSTISDKYIANFQTSATGTSYRLILHCQSTSTANYELKLDNVTVKPCTYVYGTPITDWVSYTPAGTWSTNTTWTGFWRRVGQDMEVKFQASLSGAPSGNFTANIPTGYTIDTTKLLSTGTQEEIGFGRINDSGSALYHFSLRYNSTVSIIGINLGASGTYVNEPSVVNDTTPITFGASDIVNGYFKVPITGWSSSTQVSDSYTARDIVAIYRISADKTPSASNPIDFDTKIQDTTASVTTGSGWRFTAPKSSFYDVTVTAATSTTGGTLDLYVNGSQDRGLMSMADTSVRSASASIYLRAGDYISVNPDSASKTFTGTKNNTIYIRNKDAPTTMSATEVVAARAYLDGGTVVTSGSAFAFTSISHDTHSIYNTSDGRFTAPYSGIYEVAALITYASKSWTAANTNNLQLYKNGSFHSFLDANDLQATVTGVVAVRGSGQLQLNAGEYITIVPSFTGSRSSHATAGLNWATFKRIK